MNRTWTLVLCFVIVALLTDAVLVNLSMSQRPISCFTSASVRAATIQSDLQSVQFGGVRKFMLPRGRTPNAIMVASDGFVWFGEQALPGLGHLYDNGTWVEYK